MFLGHEKMVMFLLQRSAKTAMPNLRGETSITLAMSKGNTSIVIVELVRGAERERVKDPNVKFLSRIKSDENHTEPRRS